jgi:hypothetical protein
MRSLLVFPPRRFPEDVVRTPVPEVFREAVVFFALFARAVLDVTPEPTLLPALVVFAILLLHIGC